MNSAFQPLPSSFFCHSLSTFLKVRMSKPASMLLFHSSMWLNWNTMLNLPLSLSTHRSASSAVTPLASPTVIISYLSKVSRFSSSRKS
ncbi:hypothetical protein D3C73_1358170 [compost metagenome]